MNESEFPSLKNMRNQEFEHCSESRLIDVDDPSNADDSIRINRDFDLNVIDEKVISNMETILNQAFQHCLDSRLIFPLNAASN
jgi:hypothetical protein